MKQVVAATLVGAAAAKVYMKETFDSEWWRMRGRAVVGRVPRGLCTRPPRATCQLEAHPRAASLPPLAPPPAEDWEKRWTVGSEWKPAAEVSVGGAVGGGVGAARRARGMPAGRDTWPRRAHPVHCGAARARARRARAWGAGVALCLALRETRAARGGVPTPGGARLVARDSALCWPTRTAHFVPGPAPPTRPTPRPQTGPWKHTAGDYPGKGFEDDKGIKTGEDARFYSLTAPLSAEVNNKGKDLIVSYTVKHEQNLDCGGAYMKVRAPAGGGGWRGRAPLVGALARHSTRRQDGRPTLTPALLLRNHPPPPPCAQLVPPGFNAKKFGGDTPYSIMFGPDM
jgi:hypothetical protein